MNATYIIERQRWILATSIPQKLEISYRYLADRRYKKWTMGRQQLQLVTLIIGGDLVNSFRTWKGDEDW